MPERAATERAERPAALSVLIVDDEDLIRWSLKRALHTRGHHVVEAANAAVALEAVRTTVHPFDTILLDYCLPDRRDLSLLAELRHATPASRIYMMTAFGERAMRHDARALGARVVFDKPFRVADVVALVESSRSTLL